MDVGSIIQFRYDNEMIEGKIYNINGNYYDIVGLNERNVPLEMLTVKYDMKEGDIVSYKKQNKVYEVYIIKIDQHSYSAYVKMLYRNIPNNLNDMIETDNYCVIL